MEKGTQGGASGKNQPPKDEGRGPGRESKRGDSAEDKFAESGERERGKEAGPTVRREGREDQEKRRR